MTIFGSAPHLSLGAMKFSEELPSESYISIAIHLDLLLTIQNSPRPRQGLQGWLLSTHPQPSILICQSQCKPGDSAILPSANQNIFSYLKTGDLEKGETGKTCDQFWVFQERIFLP